MTPLMFPYTALRCRSSCYRPNDQGTVGVQLLLAVPTTRVLRERLGGRGDGQEKKRSGRASNHHVAGQCRCRTSATSNDATADRRTDLHREFGAKHQHSRQLTRLLTKFRDDHGKQLHLSHIGVSQ